MSQRAVFAEVDGTLYPEVLHSMPDYDDCVSMAKEMDAEDSCDVQATWYEIGPGESDTDEFFPEDDLLKWHEKGDFEKEVESRGQTVDVVQSDTTHVMAQDLMDED